MLLLRLAGVVAAAHALSLSGSTYRVNLDFGRETGTWMPPRWAVNAGRTEYTLDLTFEEDGCASASTPRPLRGLALATGAKFPIEQASWRVDTEKGGSTLRCVLAHGGLGVSDCLRLENYGQTLGRTNTLSSAEFSRSAQLLMSNGAKAKAKAPSSESGPWRIEGKKGRGHLLF